MYKFRMKEDAILVVFELRFFLFFIMTNISIMFIFIPSITVPKNSMFIDQPQTVAINRTIIEGYGN